MTGKAARFAFEEKYTGDNRALTPAEYAQRVDGMFAKSCFETDNGADTFRETGGGN